MGTTVSMSKGGGVDEVLLVVSPSPECSLFGRQGCVDFERARDYWKAVTSTRLRLRSILIYRPVPAPHWILAALLYNETYDCLD